MHHNILFLARKTKRMTYKHDPEPGESTWGRRGQEQQLPNCELDYRNWPQEEPLCHSWGNLKATPCVSIAQ